MTENKRFPTFLNHVIFINEGHKLSREEIVKQMIEQEPLISDEEAFERHLMRKWLKGGMSDRK